MRRVGAADGRTWLLVDEGELVYGRAQERLVYAKDDAGHRVILLLLPNWDSDHSDERLLEELQKALLNEEGKG